MPAHRRKYRNRRFVKAKRRRRMPDGKKALRLVRRMQKKQEMKRVKFAQGAVNLGVIAAPNTAGVWNLVTQGDGESNREGNRIDARAIRVWAHLSWNVLGAPLDSWVRAVIVVDKDLDKDDDPVVYSGDSNVDLVMSDTFDAEFNPLTKDRYKVLWSYKKQMTPYHPAAGTYGAPKDLYFEKFVKTPNDVRFNDNAVDAYKNNVFFMVWGNPGSATNRHTISYKIRAWFKDP